LFLGVKVKLRFRKRALTSYYDDVSSLDLLAEGVIAGKRTTRYLASVRSRAIQNKSGCEYFWRRAMDRLNNLALTVDRESLEEAARVVPFPSGFDKLSKMYAMGAHDE
jgi:hypothetical protein